MPAWAADDRAVLGVLVELSGLEDVLAGAVSDRAKERIGVRHRADVRGHCPVTTGTGDARRDTETGESTHADSQNHDLPHAEIPSLSLLVGQSTAIALSRTASFPRLRPPGPKWVNSSACPWLRRTLAELQSPVAASGAAEASARLNVDRRAPSQPAAVPRDSVGQSWAVSDC